MTPPETLRQFRLLEDCLRLDYHPTTLPAQVQIWLQNLRAESEAPRGLLGGVWWLNHAKSLLAGLN